MPDLTILYYTANRLPEATARLIYADLVVTTFPAPIVSVSQQPLADFGLNLSVGDIGANKYNAYKQILVGVQNVRT
ncbi:hypothetical protein, partial [Streptococcus pneumoniae]